MRCPPACSARPTQVMLFQRSSTLGKTYVFMSFVRPCENPNQANDILAASCFAGWTRFSSCQKTAHLCQLDYASKSSLQTRSDSSKFCVRGVFSVCTDGTLRRIGQPETFGAYTEVLAELDELRRVPLLGLAYVKDNDVVHSQG